MRNLHIIGSNYDNEDRGKCMWDYIELIIYANSLPFVSLVFFIFFILHNPVFDKRQSNFFLMSACITLVMIIVISLDFIFARSELLNQQFEQLYLFRRMTSFLNFATSPMIPLIVYHIYAEKKINHSFYIPVIVNAILCLISIPTGCVFYISIGNYYDRGLLFFIPFLTTIFYMLMLIRQPGTIFTKSKQSERYFLIVVVLVLASSMYFEVIQHFLFLTWDFTAVCLIMYYLLLNIHRTIIDPLTGAYNRLAYLKEVAKIEQRKSCLLALIDINDFKDVNDLYGHDTGDKYLQEFTVVLESAFSSIGKVYRIGGDEFVLVVKKTTEAKFLEALQTAKTLASNRGMYFACGWKVYTPQMDMSVVQADIDQLMYENKHLVKEDFKKIFKS